VLADLKWHKGRLKGAMRMKKIIPQRFHFFLRAAMAAFISSN
jgi:hypothetical protein